MTHIDHSSHDHPATPAARKACRSSMIRVGDSVMVWLDDATAEKQAVVVEAHGTRYDVRLASGMYSTVYPSKIRKA